MVLASPEDSVELLHHRDSDDRRSVEQGQPVRVAQLIPSPVIVERTRWLSLSALRDYGIVISFATLFIVLSLASDVFLSRANLSNILFQAAPVGIMAAGGTLVFVAGGFDLSVGAISAFAGVIAAMVATETQLGTPTALLLGALTGLGFGVANGLFTTIGRINAFIATLASGIIIRGVAIAVTGGFLISVASDPGFATLGTGKAAGLHYPVYVWLGFALFCGFLLWMTKFGQDAYASGGNPRVARLAGVRVDLVRGTTFALSGLSGGIAGVILASEVSVGQADANLGIEFDAITAIVLGGTSIFGGQGAIWRSVLGVLLLQLIGNGFNLLNVQQVYQQVAQGGILLTAMAVDAWSRGSESR